MTAFPVFLLIVAQALAFQSDQDAVWQLQHELPKLSLRGISAVDSQTCWASGSNATVLKTIDKGLTWKTVGPKVDPDETVQLDFRDIEAFDDLSAVIMSSGKRARIYRTDDGGTTWELVFEHPNREAFFDGIAFENKEHGWLMGDPLAERLIILETKDGGQSWIELPEDRRPLVQPGEAGFAASGTNLAVADQGCLAIGLGGALPGETFPESRIAFTNNGGKSWEFASLPLARSASSGIFSICPVKQLDHQLGWIAVGGNYQEPDQFSGSSTRSDQIQSGWQIPRDSPLSGYRSCVAQGVDAAGKQILLAVGPNGTDLSSNNGIGWTRISETGFHTVDFSPDQSSAWAAGSDGRIAKWRGNR